VETRLTSVSKAGVGTTTFAYDAAGQRVKTEKPDGTIIYTPFPQFEEELRPLPPPLYPDQPRKNNSRRDVEAQKSSPLRLRVSALSFFSKPTDSSAKKREYPDH
jgi:YD repeat-containing protein